MKSQQGGVEAAMLQKVAIVRHHDNTFHNIPTKRKSRVLVILGIQAMVAASYFILDFPSSTFFDVITNSHRSLAETSEGANRDLSTKDWVTSSKVQDAFRQLCAGDQTTVASTSRKLSVDAISNIIPSAVEESGDIRLHRFLSCSGK